MYFHNLFFLVSLQYWSDELAAIAAESACMCNFQEADIPPRPFKNHFARENHIYSTENNLGDMTRHWFEEYVHYNFSTRECAEGQICEHYINVSTLHPPTIEKQKSFVASRDNLSSHLLFHPCCRLLGPAHVKLAALYRPVALKTSTRIELRLPVNQLSWRDRVPT